MRTRKKIEGKINEFRRLASEQMNLHLADKSESDIYLRMYNKIQDKIFTLEWTLKIHETC